jgi:Predicted membrane protein (DUF2207).
MKKIIFSLLLISYLLFGGEVWAEEIKNFKVDIVINKDGTIDVKETIVYDFDRLYRHGIHREIPFIKTNKEGKKFKLDFYNFSVVDESKNPYRFQKILPMKKSA